MESRVISVSKLFTRFFDVKEFQFKYHYSHLKKIETTERHGPSRVWLSTSSRNRPLSFYQPLRV